jgi:hypothetical protein
MTSAACLSGDQPNRDAIASRLMRYRDGHGDDWADIIDMLRMTPEKRRQLVGCSGSSMRWKDANHSNQGLDGGIRRG